MREVLEALGKTGAGVARELTASRRDGKITTPAAVSRWVNDRVEPPLGIWPWLRSLLVSRARALPPTLDGLKVVVVGGGKGGSGTSPICAFLAVAARSRGYRVQLGATEQSLHGLSYWTRELLGPFDRLMPIDLLKIREAKASLDGRTDLLIVDIGNKSMLSEMHLKRMDLDVVDLAVLPCNPANPMEFQPAEMAAKSLIAAGVERFMLLPMMDRMSLALLMQRARLPESLKDLGKYMSDAAIFKRSAIQTPRSPLDCSPSQFQDEDLELEYRAVLDQVLLRIGANLDHIEMHDDKFESLDIESLLVLLRGKPRYGSRHMILGSFPQ